MLFGVRWLLVFRLMFVYDGSVAFFVLMLSLVSIFVVCLFSFGKVRWGAYGVLWNWVVGKGWWICLMIGWLNSMSDSLVTICIWFGMLVRLVIILYGMLLLMRVWYMLVMDRVSNVVTSIWLSNV